jgi:hypothetical protein
MIVAAGGMIADRETVRNWEKTCQPPAMLYCTPLSLGSAVWSGSKHLNLVQSRFSLWLPHFVPVIDPLTQ